MHSPGEGGLYEIYQNPLKRPAQEEELFGSLP